MDEIKEIEETSMRIVEDYLELLKPFVQQIDRLNTRIKELEQSNDNWMIQVRLNYSRIKELEERQKWIDEVARPTHPDDERPWCAAYLDCREKIKELVEGIEKHRECKTSMPLADEELYKLIKVGE